MTRTVTQNTGNDQTETKRGIGRPRVHFDEKYSAIIQAATYLFARRGYHGTSISQICERSGVGRGAIYHYVESKEAILAAIHERFIVPLVERTTAIVEADLPAPDSLRAASRELLTTIADYQDEVTVFLHEWKALVDSDVWPTVRNQRRRFEEMIQDLICRGQETREFKNVDARLAALAFLNLHNYTYQWFQKNRAFSAEEIANTFFEILLHGIEAPGPGDQDGPAIRTERR